MIQDALIDDLQQLDTIDWGMDDGDSDRVPPNEPVCGYTDEDGPCGTLCASVALVPSGWIMCPMLIVLAQGSPVLIDMVIGVVVTVFGIIAALILG